MNNYIIFDFDGVIVDSEKIYYNKWNEAALYNGRVLSNDELLSLRSCDSSIAKELFESEEQYNNVRNKRRELIKEYLNNSKFELKNGIKNIFEYLYNKNYKIVIATSSAKEMVVLHLNYYDLNKYVTEVLSVKSLKRGKPYPDIYLEICKHYNIIPNETYAVEDSPNGVMSASSAGLKTIMIPDLSKPNDELLKLIYKTIDNPIKLKDIL